MEERVHHFTQPQCDIYTDGYDSYNGIEQDPSTVTHGAKGWARDDDNDGIREAHVSLFGGVLFGISPMNNHLSSHNHRVKRIILIYQYIPKASRLTCAAEHGAEAKRGSSVVAMLSKNMATVVEA